MRITTIIARRGINDDGLGKKHALYKLISGATTDFVYLTDDDVVPPPASEQQMLKAIGDADLLIMPLRMTSPDSRLLSRLQQAEYAAIQMLTIESARRGHPVMCSGANLLVRRERWLESWPDLHEEIASGDDMFLLESFKRRGLRIRVSDDACLEATIEAQPTLRSLLRQRMRWAGKAPRYTDRDILTCGALVLGANLLQLLCPALILVKFPLEYSLIKKRDASVSLFTALVLEIVYPLYVLVSLLGGIFRPRRW